MMMKTVDSPRPRQKRSQAATRRMLEATRALLNERDIDQISVRDIVTAAETSVGSFYHNFGTKDALFQTLVHEMAINREAIAMANFGNTTIERLPAVLVRGAIDNHRRYQGLLRAAIRQHLSGAPVWEPITAMGQNIAEEYVRRLEAHLRRPLKLREKERIAFAFVWLYGILAQSVLGLNTLSDYRVPDKIFEEETTNMFSSMLTRAVDGTDRA